MAENLINDSKEIDQLDHNTKWCDIPVDQVFQFDHQPSNVIQTGTKRDWGVGANATTNGQYNNLYEMTKRLQNKNLGGWQKWMNWVQKIQPDYKFLTVNQTNGQTCVFANVDDPWMFTQYIYQGIGKYYNPQKDQGDRAIQAQYAVIQPANYNWEDLTPKNKQATQRDLLQKGQTDAETDYICYHRVNPQGWYKKQFGQYEYKRYTTGADGCDIYRADILVQCVKWGQHGNIPPHVLNCMAPAKYLQSATKMTLKTINKPTVGIPLYSDKNGVFQKKNNKLYIHQISLQEAQAAVQDDDGYITKLPKFTGVADDSDQPIETPQLIRTKYGKVKLVSTQRQTGELLYNGCKYFKKLSDNYYGCSLDNDFTQQQRNKAYCSISGSDSCLKKNTKCKYFTKSFNLNEGTVIVARYQVHQKRFMDTDVSAQNANKQLQKIAAASVLTGTMVGAVGGLEAYGSQSKKTNLSTDGSGITIKYQTTYQMVQQPVNGIQVYIPPNSQNYKGAVVTRGTGQSAFDQPALPARSIYNNDTSPINFTRWLNQILPCYQRKFCNDTIGLNSSKKRNGYCNCGVPYKDIGDNNQIITKNSGFCPYYTQANKKNMGCPYNAVNKGALDFALHNNLMYQNLFLNLALPIATKFALAESDTTTYQTDQIIAYYQQGGQEGEQEGQGASGNIVTIYYKDVGSQRRNFVNDDMAVIYLSTSYGIQQQVLLDNHIDEKWLLCKVKFQKQDNGGIKKVNNILQCGMYVKYWPYDYGSYTDGKNAQRLKSNGQNVQWVIKVQNCDIPTRDPIFVDNQMKFVGGYHPQYMQYPASPDQILYKKQQPYDQQGAFQAMADQTQFGQGAVTATKQVQYGYFVLQTGNWILDGSSIGTLLSTQQLTNEQALDVRAQNPTNSFNGGIAIHDRWKNSKIDPQASEPETKKIVNCVVFSNDTKQSIQQLRRNPPQIQQQGSDKSEKIPPKVFYPQYLPRQRTGCFCQKCQTVLALRFYQFGDQVTKCPWCGKPFIKKQPMQYFPRTKAMGRASVWGLPGTLIKTDTYFWKSQAHVNNALIDQMCFKLGVANSQGGGYTKTEDGVESQKVDRVPYNSSTGIYSMNLTQSLVKYISSVSSVSNSTLYTQKNLVMVNPNMPKNVVKYGNYSSDKFADNRIINPFTKDFNGLKMVTMDYMVAFRNRLQPTFAYMIGRTPSASALGSTDNMSSNGQYLSADSQNPGHPDQYQMYRVNFNDRRQLSFLKKWVKRKAIVNNVVLPYAGDAQNQAQAFVQFPVGNQQQWYWAKKYYPPDPHWWYNKGYIGGIATNLTGNVCHIDKFHSNLPCHRWDQYRNIQKNLISSVFLCPHGYVPGDKIVKRAYLIQPGTQLSCDEDPIGQFQIPSTNATRVAYNHYHSFTRCDIHQHNDTLTVQGRLGHVHEDSGNFEGGDSKAYKIPNAEVQYTQICSNSKVVSFYVDKYGDKFYIDQKSGLPMYQRQYKQKYKEKFLTKTQDIHLNGWHVQNVPYIPLMTQVNIDSVLSGVAHSRDTHLGQNPTGYGTVPVNCIQWGGFGTDIIQKQTENSIWKQYTTQEFQAYQDLYSFQIQYEIDFGGGNVQTTTYPKYASNFSDFIAQQMQPIPGYFNMGGMNSSKLMKKRQKVKQVDTADIQGQYQDFIIVQGGSDPTGGNNEYQIQAGQSDMGQDITSRFKDLYYKRIQRSYTAQTSQKGLDDLKTLQASAWTGVSSNTQAVDMRKYNKRIATDNGYILNANYWLPKTQQSNSAISFTEYEKIQVQQNKIYFTTKKQQYYNISSQDTVTVTITKTEIKNGQQTTETNTYTQNILQNQQEETQLVDVSTIVNALQKCNVTNVSIVQSNIVIDADSSVQYQIEFNIADQDSSIQFECTPAGSNRIVSYTGYSGIYHPYFLTNYQPSENIRPWRTSGSQDSVQTCIIDLYHTPRQKERRDYRAQAGHMDYTNAKCTNQDCQAGKSGSPIAIYAKNNGINFSQSSDKCPFCSNKLSGGSMVDGDGIKTYIYDDLFQTDQIIRQLYVKLTQAANDVICPFAISVSSDLNDWQCIFSGLPRDLTSYSYSPLYKQNSGEGQEQEQLQSQAASQLLQIKLANFVRGRYLKISVSPVPTNKIFNLSSLTNNIKNGYISFSDSLEDVDDGGLKNCFCRVSLSRTIDGTTTQHSFNINIINNSKGKLYFNTTLIKETDTIKSIAIQAKIYKTCFSYIKVGGVSYSQNQLTIMPKPTTLSYDYDSSGISLNYLPIQFFKVSVLINDSCQIILSQVQDYDKIDTDEGLRFFVQTVTESFDVIKRDDKGNPVLDQSGNTQIENRSIQYYRIKSGRFYFDVAKKKIMLPRYYYSQQNILQVPFGTKDAAKPSPPKQDIKKPTGSNQDDPDYNPNYAVTTSYYKFSKDQLTENLTKWGITKKLIPTKMHAVLWSGMQGGVDLKINADGPGPSYQVEKGSICFIDTQKYQSGGQCDNGLSTPLPDTTTVYQHARDINNSTTKREIPWIVYNNQVVTLQTQNNLAGLSGRFNVYTTATQRTQLGQQWFVTQIMGEHCSKASGRCSGYITLKGRPNTIICGPLKVHAAAVTKRNFCGDIYSYQLTGGFDQQGILLTPKVKKQKDRCAVGYYLPYILVYLAQYSPLGTTEPQFVGYNDDIGVVGEQE